MDWTGLENRLAQTIGLESSSLGETVIRQSIGRRMRARETESQTDYLKLVDFDAAEFQALIEELVVRESWFFRHAHAFELVQRHAISTMAARHEPYRVLSFPCAGGEEPYSIVMALREAGLGFHQFQVAAADISETALQTARRGNYGLRSVRVVAPAIQDRYFRVADQTVEVLPEIRQAVRFIRANIIDARSELDGDTFDAVFCRNLLIYLTPAARQRVIKAVLLWLASGGLFFVGHAEVLREFEELFEPVAERGAFAFCRRTVVEDAPSGRLAPTPAAAGPVRPNPMLVHPPAAMPTSNRDPRQVDQTAAPIKSVSTPGDELARKVSEFSSAARHREAIELCEQQLRQNGPSARVYHLLGMVYQAAGMHEQAEQALERAVYLDPDHEEALLALALLARRRGDLQIAERIEQRSQRARERRERT